MTWSGRFTLTSAGSSDLSRGDLDLDEHRVSENPGLGGFRSWHSPKMKHITHSDQVSVRAKFPLLAITMVLVDANDKLPGSFRGQAIRKLGWKSLW